MIEEKNVLVTGGAGYIGSHACKALRDEGFIPITLDNLSNGWVDAVKFGPFERVDLLNREALNQVFEKYRPHAVMHFAALSEVEESVRDPGRYWRNNLVGSLNLLEALIKYGCNKLVFSSTCAIYGNHDNIVLTENTPQMPVNPYGASKRAVEEMIHQFSMMTDLRYVIFRYFNVAGADPSAEIGEFHQPETHLIPLVLHAISGKSEAIKIFGTDYNTPDGTCIRDYVHVCDLVDAHIAGLDWLKKNKNSRIYNLGTGHGFSVREVIEQAKTVTNTMVPQVESTRRPGDCTKLVSDSTLANTELEWQAKRSSLNQMISDAWRWHQNGLYNK